MDTNPLFYVPHEPLENLHQHVLKRWRVLEVATIVNKCEARST
jgi:hypothetical protein